jgi:2-methylisocitrate lyase-like PEP mutase family enzyme
MPELPEFNRLAELGVKRISMGNFVHAQLQQQLLNMLKNIRAEQSFHPVFDHASY